MAVLYETRTCAGPLLSLLRESGIPYTQFKETGLFSSEEALTWAYLLEYCAESSPQNLKKLLLTDFFGQDPCAVIAGEAMERSETIAGAWQELAGAGKWAQLVRAVCADTALFCRALGRTDGKRVVAAYRQLGEWAAARLIADHLSPGDTARLLRAFRSGARAPAEEEERFRRETEEDAVRAATIHSSKGLQFDVVFLLGGNSRSKSPAAPFVVRADGERKREKILVSLDPAHRALMAEEDECERRRLLYVGLTRARYKMVLPQWKEPGTDKKTGAIIHDKMSFYDRNILAAYQAQGGLFTLDTTATDHTAAPREQAWRRPRADTFTIADTDALRTAELELSKDAAGLGIAGRRRLLHSYTSLAHPGRATGNQWQDETHESQQAVYGNLPEQLRLSPGSVLYARQEPPQEPAQQGRLALRGRETGSALHEILEEFGSSGNGFSSVNGGNGDLLRSIERRFGAYGLLDKSAEKRADTCRQIAGLITAALALPIPLVNGESLRPSEIPEKDCCAESFFAATVGRNCGALAPENGGADAVDRVIGFIDLVFRKGKEIYLLDWKSDTLDFPSSSPPASRGCASKTPEGTSSCSPGRASRSGTPCSKAAA
jgi:exodeoxyribonuclease V beta subunit